MLCPWVLLHPWPLSLLWAREFFGQELFGWVSCMRWYFLSPPPWCREETCGHTKTSDLLQTSPPDLCFILLIRSASSQGMAGILLLPHRNYMCLRTYAQGQKA